MELSCKSEYILLALLELASHYHTQEPLQLRQIAQRQNIPNRYLEQLLVNLKRSGLVISHRGAKGGYFLAKEPTAITLLEVMNCIEGFDQENPKADGTTGERQVIQKLWREVSAGAQKVLAGYTLQDLVEQCQIMQQSSNLMYYI